MQHLDEGTIHAWLDGALSADEAASVDAHARTCAECAAMVAEARGLIAGASRIVSSLDVVRGNVIPSTAATAPGRGKSVWHRLRMTPARSAIAATLLVGVASMFAVREQRVREATPTVEVPHVVDTAIKLEAARVPEPAQSAQSAQSAKPAKPATKKREAPAPKTSVASPPMQALRSTEVAADSSATAQRRMATTAMSARAAVAGAPPPVANVADVRAPASIGCYRIAFDSSWARVFPERFALSLNERGQQVVSVPHLADSVLVGADWHSTPQATTVVRLTAPERATITFGADGVGQLRAENRTSPANVQRVPCDR